MVATNNAPSECVRFCQLLVWRAALAAIRSTIRHILRLSRTHGDGRRPVTKRVTPLALELDANEPGESTLCSRGRVVRQPSDPDKTAGRQDAWRKRDAPPLSLPGDDTEDHAPVAAVFGGVPGQPGHAIPSCHAAGSAAAAPPSSAHGGGCRQPRGTQN